MEPPLVTDLVPYLSERGVVEVDLALARMQVRQLQLQLEEERNAHTEERDYPAEPSV